MSMNRRKERYFSSRSFMPSRMIRFQSAGSFQSLSAGDHSRGFGRSRYFRFFGAAL